MHAALLQLDLSPVSTPTARCDYAFGKPCKTSYAHRVRVTCVHMDRSAMQAWENTNVENVSYVTSTDGRSHPTAT
eukprot:365262-Chlamydomonas_euryale.AAC.5